MKKLVNKKYTIIVSTCDTHEDLWEPFFCFLTKHWRGIEQKTILLNTETKSFHYKNLDIRTSGLNLSGVDWAKRFKKHLEKVPTEYVLVLLEDFFLEREVDEEKIDFCIEEMEKDKEITSFSFVPTLWKNIDDGKFQDFELRPKVAPFRVNLQAGIWRKKALIKLIRTHETPWEFEMFASIRSRLTRGKFYVAKEGKDQAFVYDWVNGGAVHRGKWTNSAVKILTENNFNIDFSKRGFDTANNIDEKELLRKKRESTCWGRFLIRVNLIIKHWRSFV